jgi:large subunit ribosomal protein L19
MANQTTIRDTKVRVGDTIKVYQLIKEGDKERTQIYQGIVIGIKGAQENQTFTVRRIATGSVGVERIWPVVSPWITQVQVVKQGDVRRAKLYYLRKRVGRRATKVKEKLVEKKEKAPQKVKKTTVKTPAKHVTAKKAAGKAGRKSGKKAARK